MIPPASTVLAAVCSRVPLDTVDLLPLDGYAVGEPQDFSLQDQTAEPGRSRIEICASVFAKPIKTQICVAQIALSAPKHPRPQAAHAWSLSNLVTLLRHQLFAYSDPCRWMDESF